jgi:hypothetical protein
MPIMKYRLLRQIPTMLGATVHVAELDSGEQVLVKRAETETEALALREYARHLRFLSRLPGHGSTYPPVLDHDDRRLVLPFFRHGSVDRVDDVPTLRALTGRALDSLFRIAALAPPPAAGPVDRQELGRSFLPTEARARLQRLDRALSSTAAGRSWAAGPAPSRHLAGLTAWFRDGSLERCAAAIAPPFLGLAAHGDLGLNNVVLTEPAGPDAAFVFIDTRGRWHQGLPLWDPVMDLATLLVFHCRIEPALAAALEPDGEAARRPRLTEGEILELCSASPGFQAWAALDPQWRTRLQVHLAVRLLGNVGIQLTIAPERRAERADVLFGLFAGQMERVRQALG